MGNQKLKVTDFLIIINVALIALNFFVLDGDIRVSITIVILTTYVLYRRFKELKALKEKKSMENKNKGNRAYRRRK